MLAVITAVLFGSFYVYKYFAPKYKEVEREVWENTPSRVEGVIQDINTRLLEYNSAEDELEKKAICEYIRNSYPDITPDEIDDYTLRNFFQKCKYGG